MIDTCSDAEQKNAMIKFAAIVHMYLGIIFKQGYNLEKVGEEINPYCSTFGVRFK